MWRYVIVFLLVFAVLAAAQVAAADTAEEILLEWSKTKDPAEAAELWQRYITAMAGDTTPQQTGEAEPIFPFDGVPEQQEEEAEQDFAVDTTLEKWASATGAAGIDAFMQEYVSAVAAETAYIRSLPNWQELYQPPAPTVNPIFIKHGDLIRESFAFLDARNPLIARFNARNGDGERAQSPYPYGLPYLWAGKNIKGDPMRVTYIPEYSGETKEYKFNRAYLEGFDCSGYISYVYRRITGNKEFIPSISAMIDRRGQHVDISDMSVSAYKRLQIGDLFVCSDRAGGASNHVLMYIGTLADYGYVASEIPTLAKYLEYPLVIHCSTNNFQREWFIRYIEESRIAEMKNVGTVWPPDGGVMVSLIGVPLMAATKVEPLFNGAKDVYSFDLEGYELTIYPIFTKKEYAVYRP